MPSIDDLMSSGFKTLSGTFILPTVNPDRSISQNFKHLGSQYGPHYDMFMLADKYDVRTTVRSDLVSYADMDVDSGASTILR
jgi:hypothetical protein